MERKMASVRVSEDVKAEIKQAMKQKGFSKESAVICDWMRSSKSVFADLKNEIKQLKEENQAWKEQFEVEKYAGSELYDMMEKTTKLLNEYLGHTVVFASLHREVLKIVKENEELHLLSEKNGDLININSELCGKINKMKQSYDEVSSSIQSILKLGDFNG